MGAQAVFVARHRKQLGRRVADNAFRELGFIMVLNFLVARGQLVDHWGHLGGFIGGAVAAGLLGPCWRMVNGRYIDQPPIPVFAQNPVSKLR